MARNGSGTFSLLATVAPANTVSSSTTVNSVMDDIAIGLTDSINIDGTKAWEANQSLGGFKTTSVGSGSARTDGLNIGQVQDAKANWVAAGGTADVITATYAPAITALVDGQECCFRASGANTVTTPTFSPNSLTARTIVKNGAAALAAGDISGADHEVRLRYKLADTRWELQNPKGVSSGAITGSGLTMTTARLLGRTTASTGAVEEMTVGAGLTLSAGSLVKADITVNVQTMTATGSGDSWEKPTGGQTMCMVELWGGGGSGGKGRAASAGAGGGGGQYVRKIFLISALGATEPVTVGAGGASQTNADSNGTVGANTTFGAAATLVTAYGGGPGMGTDTGGENGGGHGGGPNSAGGTQTLKNAAVFDVANYTITSRNEGQGGKIGPSGQAASFGMSTTYNGAGGGGSQEGTTLAAGGGGDSLYGGAGGGAGAEDVAPGPGTGGTSQFGGNGGAGAFDASNATAGTQPAGGGGGSETGNSGAGGDGKAVITCW